MTDQDKQIETFLKALPFFAGLPEKDVAPIFQNGKVHKYAKGEHLFFHGDRAEKFYVVIGGCIKVYSETLEGDESVILLITQGMNVGEASVFDDAIYPFSACAAENSEVFEVSADLLKSQAEKSSEFTARIMAIMSRELTHLHRQKEQAAVFTASQRVGCMLLKLTENIPDQGGTFTLPYDKALAAASLSMKPESFARALEELSQHGVHVNGREITINNFTELANHSCVHCSALDDHCQGRKRQCSGQSRHCPRPNK